MTGFITAAQQADFASGNLFKYIFGRKPNLKLDRPFLINYLTTIEKTMPEILESMLEKGMSEGQIEAIYETGIVPTEEDFHQYPAILLQFWLQIANDTREKKSKVETRLSPRVTTHPYGIALTTIYAEINNTIMRLSHVIDTSFNLPGNSALNDLLFYYISRTIQIVRAIRVLINNDEGGIIVSLSRNLLSALSTSNF